MKIFPSLLISLAVFLNSCTGVQNIRVLNEMEALMSERPDSALTVLQELKTRDIHGLHIRPLHALLLSEALDKNYIDLTDDSLAITANRYYGEHGSKHRRVKSWYYLGRVRYNAGNYAEAVICYDKALSYAEAIKDFHYAGLINREISNSFSKVFDSLHAKEFIQKSVEAFDAAEEMRYAAYSRLALARLLRNQKKYDKSLEQIEWILQNCSEDYLLSSAYELEALLLLAEEKIDLEQVKLCYEKAQIGSVLPATSSRYSNLALVYQLAGDIDSSDLFLNKALSTIASKEDSLLIVFNQYRILSKRKEFSKSNEKIEEYLTLQDPTLYDMLSQSVSFYQSSYYQNESRIKDLKARNRISIFSIIILIMIAISIALILKNRGQQRIIVEEMARTAEIQQEISVMQIEKESMSNALAVLFENRLKILQTLSDQYDLIDENQTRKKKEAGVELSKDEILCLFRDKIKDLRKDKDIALSMEETLNAWKDNIMLKFRTVFGENSQAKIRMSSEDFELMPFYFSGMKQKTISYLTNRTEHSIKERKRRIKQKIEALDDTFTSEKQLFLSNL